MGPGTWTIHSDSDNRWCRSGRASVISGIGPAPREAQEMMDLLEELYGTPPEDLSWGWMKD